MRRVSRGQVGPQGRGAVHAGGGPNYLSVIGLVVAPIVALGGDPTALQSCSPQSVSRSPSPGRCWYPAGSRYFALNWIRFLAVLAAFVFFWRP